MCPVCQADLEDLEDLADLADLGGQMVQMGRRSCHLTMGLGPSSELSRQNKAGHQVRGNNRRVLKLNRPGWMESSPSISRSQLAIHTPGLRMQDWPSRREEGIGRC